MAGSYKHCVTDAGKLRKGDSFTDLIENLGDAWEAIEEMYGMIWLLASEQSTTADLAVIVEDARTRYKEGMALSPGVSERNRPKSRRPRGWPFDA